MPEPTQRERLTYPVAFAVLLVWVACAAYALVASVFVPLEVTTPVMLVLAGYVFGIRITKDVK